MALTLPQSPAQHFIDQLLLPEWDETEARGYDTHKRLIVANNESHTVAAGETESYDSVTVKSGGSLTVDGTLKTATLTVDGSITVNGTLSIDGDLFVGLDDTTAEEFFPVATSIDDVGAFYPSLVIQFSSGSSGGGSTYDYLTTNGPGQNRTVSLLATARAQDRESDYSGDSATHTTVEAEDIVEQLIEAVENLCERNAQGGGSEFHAVGSQRAADAPDGLDEINGITLDGDATDTLWLQQKYKPEWAGDNGVARLKLDAKRHRFYEKTHTGAIYANLNRQEEEQETDDDAPF